MSYEFMSLAEVEALPEVPENATVFAEVDGSIKRIPGKGLGGSGNNLVIVEPSFIDFYTPVEVTSIDNTYTANMEFADAFAAFRACELTNVVMYVADGSPFCLNCVVCDYGVNKDFGDCLAIRALMDNDVYTTLYWTADGISTEKPNSGGGEA